MSDANLKATKRNVKDYGKSLVDKGTYHGRIIDVKHYLHPKRGYDILELFLEIIEGPLKDESCEKSYQLNTEGSFDFCYEELNKIGFPFNDLAEFEALLPNLLDLLVSFSVVDNGKTAVLIHGLHRPVKDDGCSLRDTLWAKHTAKRLINH